MPVHQESWHRTPEPLLRVLTGVQSPMKLQVHSQICKFMWLLAEFIHVLAVIELTTGCFFKVSREDRSPLLNASRWLRNYKSLILVLKTASVMIKPTQFYWLSHKFLSTLDPMVHYYKYNHLFLNQCSQFLWPDLFAIPAYGHPQLDLPTWVTLAIYLHKSDIKSDWIVQPGWMLWTWISSHTATLIFTCI